MESKTFLLPGHKFCVRNIYVSQFSHPGKHKKKHCFRNNISEFSQALRTYAQVVNKAVNVVTSRCRFAKEGTELFISEC